MRSPFSGADIIHRCCGAAQRLCRQSGFIEHVNATSSGSLSMSERLTMRHLSHSAHWTHSDSIVVWAHSFGCSLWVSRARFSFLGWYDWGKVDSMKRVGPVPAVCRRLLRPPAASAASAAASRAACFAAALAAAAACASGSSSSSSSSAAVESCGAGAAARPSPMSRRHSSLARSSRSTTSSSK